MLTQWELHDSVTTNNLGNGKFFSTLRCLFVLVRWESIVHDDYPWSILFWVEITGIPLHLWTIKNLRNIGSKLGYIDMKPLVFTKKILSPEADDVSIKISYDKIFKHYTTCGMMTHDITTCLKKDLGTISRVERPGVFSRVPLPFGEPVQQPFLKERRYPESYELKSVANRYGSRYAAFDKNNTQSWRVKEISDNDALSNDVVRQNIVPYERENVLPIPITNGEMMEFDEQVDDLLGSELMDMEAHSLSTAQRLQSRTGVPLGTQSNKITFLSCGSPRKRTEVYCPRVTMKQKRQHHSLTRKDGGCSKDDDLMGSKNPSRRQS
ncbi:hypothetical protein N665_0018s0031 [Sinapis alba]|nr:hypothetical protein N665_0018s0031 [Sinapis alba]